MIHPPSRAETVLLTGCAALAAIALAAPALGQSVHYHQFADARGWLGLPNAANVLSNLLFLLFGLYGWALLARVRAAMGRVELAGATVFFGGLLLTAAASSIYHWQPVDATLALDRSAMAAAFAGLLALATAGRVGSRAAVMLGVALLAAGPVSVWIWLESGNLLPWALVQGGGMLLLVALALKSPLAGALAVRWGWVVGIYAVAKVLEIADQAVFDFTGAALSGHSAKHVVAAFSALPVIFALNRRLRTAHNPQASAGAPPNQTTLA